MATERQNYRKLNAVEQRDIRAQRDPAQQLAQLDARLGVGVGATRERARLQQQLADVLA